MTSFPTDIAPLFRERDRAATDFMFDLSHYDDIKDNAGAILEVVQDGSMPCDESWPQDRVEAFRSWTAAGCLS